MKKEKLTTEYLELLDLFCSRVNFASCVPEYEDKKIELGGELVPVDIGKSEVKHISIAMLNLINNFFEDSGLSFFEEVKYNPDPSDERFYVLIIRPEWFAKWYKSYQKIRFHSFIHYNPQELNALSATIQILNETQVSDTLAEVEDGYLPILNEEIIAKSSISIPDFHNKVDASLKLFMELGVVKTISIKVDNSKVIEFNDLLLERTSLAVKDILEGGVLMLGGTPKLINEQKELKTPKFQTGQYTITYSKRREVILNETYIIGNPNFNSENDIVFEYLYKNPNIKFTRSQIEQNIKTKLTKDFDKIVENLGFRKDLRKIFFEVSKDIILFRNPVSKEQLEEMNLTFIKI